MAVKKFKPTTPGLRYKTVIKTEGLSKNKPHKSLVKIYNAKAGRNNYGRKTVRHRGGGHKRRYRLIDFLRNKKDIPATVKSIEYDPNRNANISLVCYADGEYRYILAPEGLKPGAKVISGENVATEIGNASPLGNLPFGIDVHNIELYPGRGGQFVRSAGAFASIAGRDGKYTIIKMPSGELRKVLNTCYATIGAVGNSEYELLTLGKAGRSRWLGKRPSVRGVAMNPVDHPHGGGEGKASGGRHPVTPWGKHTKGKKTRSVKRTTSKFIIKGRK